MYACALGPENTWLVVRWGLSGRCVVPAGLWLPGSCAFCHALCQSFLSPAWLPLRAFHLPFWKWGYGPWLGVFRWGGELSDGLPAVLGRAPQRSPPWRPACGGFMVASRWLYGGTCAGNPFSVPDQAQEGGCN